MLFRSVHGPVWGLLWRRDEVGDWEVRWRLSMELPLHRWQDRKWRLQSLKELRVGPRAGCPLCLLVRSFPAPVASPGASTSSGHCSRLPDPQRVGWSQSPRLQWLQLEVCGFRAQAVPPRRLSPHLARPHNARPLSSLSVRLWEAPGLLKDQHKTHPQV